MAIQIARVFVRALRWDGKGWLIKNHSSRRGSLRRDPRLLRLVVPHSPFPMEFP
jgi:hypothetical protein